MYIEEKSRINDIVAEVNYTDTGKGEGEWRMGGWWDRLLTELKVTKQMHIEKIALSTIVWQQFESSLYAIDYT